MKRKMTDLAFRLTNDGFGNLLRFGKDTAQRQPEESATDLVNETAARVTAARIQFRVTEHK